MWPLWQAMLVLAAGTAATALEAHFGDLHRHAIAQDGETTWFEGVLLRAIYALFALAFYFV